MNIILLGPPGAGKGTQGALLAEQMRVPKIATGDLLRAAVKNGTELGTKAQGYMDQGLLVPDDIILGLIREVLESPEAAEGVIMDGFPRTVAQAQAVDEFLGMRGTQVDRVLTFEVPEPELVTRLLGRAGQDGRSDDAPGAIQQRLAVYRAQTEPLIQFYDDRGILRQINGVGSIENIAERVSGALAE